MIELKNKTLQQISDEIAEVLIKQGEVCRGFGVFCQYGFEGKHCAVGHCLPNTVEFMTYQGEVGDLLTDFSSDCENVENLTIIKDNYQFFESIQTFHDSSLVYKIQNHISIIKTMYKINLDAWLPWFESVKKMSVEL